jgi:hypothetical protein
MSLQSAIKALKRRATFTPEYQPDGASSEIERGCQSLLGTYPDLKNYSDYLEFLKMTGGSHIHNRDFSLGIYGFGGYVVTSFDEGLFLDEERYFRFGEVLYQAQPDPVYAFAFDFQKADDVVHISPIDESCYAPCCSSFAELVEDFAAGNYPRFRK